MHSGILGDGLVGQIILITTVHLCFCYPFTFSRDIRASIGFDLQDEALSASRCRAPFTEQKTVRFDRNRPESQEQAREKGVTTN